MLYENFLNKDAYELIAKSFKASSVQWYWNKNTTYHEDPNEDIFQFVHNLYSDNRVDSDLFEVVRPLLIEFEKVTSLKIKNIVRIKANLLPKLNVSEEAIKKTIHTDGTNKNCLSLIYYVMDSDGDTVIYDDDESNEIERASPIANNAIMFQSTKPHHATPPKENNRRIVINCVFEV
jgi:hypothetical protein